MPARKRGIRAIGIPVGDVEGLVVFHSRQNDLGVIVCDLILKRGVQSVIGVIGAVRGRSVFLGGCH